MAPKVTPTALALAAAALLRHGSLAGATQSACPAGAAPEHDGSCGALQKDHVLLQVDHGGKIAIGRHASGEDEVVTDAGFCCHWAASAANACGQCGSKAPAGSWCATSEKTCAGDCKATWCPAGGGASAAEDPAPTPDPVPVPDPAPTPAPSPPYANGLVWADEFDGDGVDRSKWRFEVANGGFGNNELQYYTDRWANSPVTDGTLKITAKCEQYGGNHYTSAKLMSTAAWGPGHRVEVRARMSANRGTWPAIWMLPKTSSYGPWPKSGEIDIMEHVGCDKNTVHATIHTGSYNWKLNTQKTNSIWADVTAWHTYGLKWTDSQLVWSVDGKDYFWFNRERNAGSDRWPYDKEFFLILNFAVGGNWGGMCLHGQWPSCSDGSQFGQPQVLEVDYARIYTL